jgi:hypothetical protein
VETHARPQTAERAGVGVEELSQLVVLGILTPDADSEGDLRRMGLMQSGNRARTT